MREVFFSGFHALGSFIENEERAGSWRDLKEEKVWNNLHSATASLLETHGEISGKALSVNLRSEFRILSWNMSIWCEHSSPGFISVCLFPPPNFPFSLASPSLRGPQGLLPCLFQTSLKDFSGSPDLKGYDSGLGVPSLNAPIIWTPWGQGQFCTVHNFVPNAKHGGWDTRVLD